MVYCPNFNDKHGRSRGSQIQTLYHSVIRRPWFVRLTVDKKQQSTGRVTSLLLNPEEIQ